MHVDKIIARLKSSEQLLSEAFLLVADRHRDEAEIRDVARTIASWSAEHVKRLGQVEKRYGTSRARRPERLRATMFHGSRAGSLRVVDDLQDLALLAQQTLLLWTILRQSARALMDTELEESCHRALALSERQYKWAVSKLESLAPQAITVPSVRHSRRRAAFHRLAAVLESWRRPFRANATPSVKATALSMLGSARARWRSA